MLARRLMALGPRAAPAMPGALVLASILLASTHPLAAAPARALAAGGLGLALWRVALRVRPVGPWLEARPLAATLPALALPVAAAAASILSVDIAASLALGAVGVLCGLATAAFGLTLWNGSRLRRVGGTLALLAILAFAALEGATGRVPLLLAVPVLVGILQMVLRAPGTGGFLDRDDAKPVLLAFAFGALALLATPPAAPGPATTALLTGGAVGLALGALGVRAAQGREPMPVPLAAVLYLAAAAVAIDIVGPFSLWTQLVLTMSAAMFALRLLLALRPVAALLGRCRAGRLAADVVVALLGVGPLVALGFGLGIDALGTPATLLLDLTFPFATLAVLGFFALFVFGGVITAELLYGIAETPKPPARLLRDPVRSAWVAMASALVLASLLLLASRLLWDGWSPLVRTMVGFGILGGLALALACATLGVAAVRGIGRDLLARRVTFLSVYAVPMAVFAGYAFATSGEYAGVPPPTLLLLGYATLQTLSQLPTRAERGRWLAPAATWEIVLALLFAGGMGFALNSGSDGVVGTLETIDTSEMFGLLFALAILPAWRFARGWRARRKGLPEGSVSATT